MRDRESGAGGRFIGIEEADLVFLGDAGKAWLAGDGPGQVPVEPHPLAATSGRPTSGSGSTPGQIGVYLAKSLGGGEPMRLIVRLQRRF